MSDVDSFLQQPIERRTLLLPTRLLLRLTLIDSVVIYDAELLWRRGLDAGLNISGRREISGRAH